MQPLLIADNMKILIEINLLPCHEQVCPSSIVSKHNTFKKNSPLLCNNIGYIQNA